MARRKSYGRKNTYGGRRIFLFIAFSTVAALAIWKVVPISRAGGDLLSFLHLKTENPSSTPVAPAVVKPVKKTEAAPVDITPIAAASEPIKGTPLESAVAVNAVNKKISPQVSNSLVIDQSAHVQADKILKPLSPDPAQADKLYQQGLAAIARQDYITARDKLSLAVRLGLSPEKEAQARKMLNEASDHWLFSRTVYSRDALCQRYKVASGDILAKIGKKFNVPYQLLMRINGIKKANSLRAGQSIKVVKGPFHVVIDRGRFLLTVYLNDFIVKTYKIATGCPGRETPTGLWVVKVGKKQVNPAWTDRETGKHYYPNDPENPLGERWIGMDGLEGDAVGKTGFGIHGTIEPDKIGSQASRGCIRMLNKDVKVVYDLLCEGKSKVQIID